MSLNECCLPFFFIHYLLLVYIAHTFFKKQITLLFKYPLFAESSRIVLIKLKILLIKHIL